MPHPGMNNPARPFWQNLFPYEYWANRIEKVNSINPHDKLEALVLASQLADLYTHIFVAKVRNPYQPWFMLKEATQGYHIKETLEDLTVKEGGPETILVEELLDEPDSLISYQLVDEEWDADLYDLIAADFLGCPTEFKADEKSIEFLEEPGLHYGSTNAILNFSQDNLELLNDFKHGFRVLPFEAEDLDQVLDQSRFENPETADELQEKVANNDSGWKLHFFRMRTQEVTDTDSYDFEVSLDIHRAHLHPCLSFARLTLYKLHNLFGRGGRHYVEPYLTELHNQAEIENDAYTLIEKMGELNLAFDPEYASGNEG